MIELIRTSRPIDSPITVDAVRASSAPLARSLHFLPSPCCLPHTSMAASACGARTPWEQGVGSAKRPCHQHSGHCLEAGLVATTLVIVFDRGSIDMLKGLDGHSAYSFCSFWTFASVKMSCVKTAAASPYYKQRDFRGRETPTVSKLGRKHCGKNKSPQLIPYGWYYK